MILEAIIDLVRGAVGDLGLSFVETSRTPGYTITSSRHGNVYHEVRYYVAIIVSGRNNSKGRSVIYFYSDNIVYCQTLPFESTEIFYADPECMGKLRELLKETHKCQCIGIFSPNYRSKVIVL